MRMLQVNDVLRFSEDEHCERLLWLDPAAEGGWFIDIEHSSTMPIWRREAELEEILSEGLAAPVADPWAGSGAAPTTVQARRRDEAWDAIRPLAQAQPKLFLPQERATLVDARADEIGTTRQKLYRLLRRWWQRGMTPAALTPDYAKSGGLGKPKANGSVKRGRPVIHGAEGMNIDAAAREIFRDAVTRYYARNRSFDLAACYHECMRNHFSDAVIDEHHGRQRFILREPHPTLNQFRYWYAQDNDNFAVERRRRTPRVYDKDSRGILGTSMGEVVGPGSRFQIDATIADIYLISRFDRGRIVGRPVVYVVIDVFSRMIAGLYVGFEGPSWVGAMMALANAAAPKASWCHTFGVEMDEAEWPCRCLPSVILADRGEMLGEAADPLVQRFGIRIENAAPYRADWKGIVERRFGLIHAAFRPYAPGYVAPDFRERGAHDYRLDATLDLDEFTAAIIECVRHYNTQHMITGYPRDADMVADKVLPIPIDLWEWGIQRRTGMQRSFPEELVKLTLLPTDHATVTPQGIRFQGCYYSCSRAIEEHWFDKARQTRTWKVPISYEPRLMDTIWLRDPKGREDFTPCQLTGRSADMRSKTLWEIDQLRKEDRRQRGEHKAGQLQGKIDLNVRLEAIIEKAKRERPDETRSKAERVGRIRSNRAEERDANRKREAFQNSSAAAPRNSGKILPFGDASRPAIEDYSIPDIAHIRKRLSERDGEDGN